MGEKEISATAEVSVGGGLLPFQGKLATTMTHRFGKRGGEALDPSLAAMGNARLIKLLGVNEELDVWPFARLMPLLSRLALQNADCWARS